MPRMRRTLFVLVALWLGLAGPASGNVELKLRIDSTPPASLRSGQRSSERRQSVIQVTLGPGYLRVEKEGGVVIRDFSKRRIYSIDPANGTVRDDSLFSDVGFRARELDNRVFLGEVMGKAGLKENPVPLFLSEHQMSLQAKGDPEAVTHHETGGEVLYEWNGQPVFSCSLDALPATDAERHAFVRFLRYEVGGHPAILADLESRSGIPRRVHIYGSAVVHDERCEILERSVTADAPYSLTNLRAAAVDEELAEAVAAVRQSTAESLDSSLARLVTEAEELAGAKHQLEAMLTFLEYTLVSGRNLPPEFEPRKNALVADPGVHRLLESLNPASEAAARKALTVLASLRKSAGDKRYVTYIFEANIRTSLGQESTAIENFRSVLAKQPLLTGVWKDLGELYLGGYDAQRAWICWDAARRLAPTHPLLKDVGAREEKLLADYPDFF
jgi:hypothetical protein